MNFGEVDRRYAELKQQYQAGTLSAEQFDEELKALMVQDDQGRWWAKARESGAWNYYDAASGEWMQANPPTAQASQAPQTPPMPPPQSPAGGYAAAPAPAPGGYAVSGMAGQPELSSGLKIVFYILSFLVPIVGIVLFFVYRNKPIQEDRSAANLFLILGLVSFGLSCFCYIMAIAASGAGSF